MERILSSIRRAVDAPAVGADAIIARCFSARSQSDTPERIAEADTDRYFASIGVPIIDGGIRAYYSPADDTNHVRPIGQFDNACQFHGSSPLA